ncbi:MAG TPA: DNA polymerase III subunit chi [Gammaproteobacteria bacterium]|nr:DNA polymerase III subunit chi [Gammaproteobacteria bacterium]
MTRIDFYILGSRHPQAAWQTACRLAEKAYRLQHAIYIHTPDADHSEQLDKLLWTFRDGSFVPHCLHAEPHADHSPVLIGHDPRPEEELRHHQLLINLDHEVPPFFSRFERVAEIVGAEEQQRRQGRERFRFYRERGYELQTHELAG